MDNSRIMVLTGMSSILSSCIAYNYYTDLAKAKSNLALTGNFFAQPGPHWWEASALTTAQSALSLAPHIAFLC